MIGLRVAAVVALLGVAAASGLSLMESGVAAPSPAGVVVVSVVVAATVGMTAQALVIMFGNEDRR